jgi:putative transposase
MVRLTRLVVGGLAHMIQLKAVAHTTAFTSTAEHELFMQALCRSATQHGVALQAYALLPDEVLLLATPTLPNNLSAMMQALARFYVGPFNRRHARQGALWQSRFRAAPVGGAAELLACMLFIEQAPVRCGHTKAAADFAWSSARHHAGMASVSVGLASAPAESAYWQLGNTPFEREAAYAARLKEPLPQVQVAQVQATVLKGWAMGSAEFINQLSAQALRRPAAQARGRPRRHP